ncbi:MAG: PRC-barrel domain-containing protein [Patescibacteria group bacterium]
MQKSFREVVGLPIRDRLSQGLLGRVADIIVNPTNGEVLALFTRRDKKLILPVVDIVKISADAVWVESPEALATPSEIIRIAEIIKLNIPIFTNKVFTVSRQFLGEVIDFRFETSGWVLTKIEVAKKILGIPTAQKLINSSQIVRIKSNEITVRDAVVLVREKKIAEKEVAQNLTPAALQIEENAD